MLPEYALTTLIMALIFSGMQCVCPTIGLLRHQRTFIHIGKPAAYAQATCVVVSFFLLMISFLHNDFSIAYVAEHSHSLLPWPYRAAAVWSAHEGSLLLWVTILSLWTVVFTMQSYTLSKEAQARVLAILGGISFGFLAFLLFTSNPFLRLLPDVPLNGQDLNPLLQDPGLVSHPPMLYLGYVGSAVSYALVMAALWEGQFSKQWIQLLRFWSTLAWCFLTLGIILGSWWAYRVLGWGGWWFWDPVENASLMPWLVTTALLHALALCDRHRMAFNWVVFLAITAFALSLVGTFLVRSGVVISVHAFASDPTRGAYLLQFLITILIASFIFYGIRAHRFSVPIQLTVCSRETLLFANNWILIVMAFTVMLGTLYPLILDALGMTKLSVGPPYFNILFAPLSGLLLALLGIVSAIPFGKVSVKKLLLHLRIPLTLTVLSMVALGYLLPIFQHPVAWISLSLAIWVVINTVIGGIRLFRHTHTLSLGWIGMHFAHIGVAICAIGIATSLALQSERDVSLTLGETVQLKETQYLFKALLPINGSNYRGTAAEIILLNPPHSSITLLTERRLYFVRNIPNTVAAVDASWHGDRYIALGEMLSPNTIALRIYDKPLIRWIWYGGLLMALGGICAVIHRYKPTQRNDR